MLTPQQVKNHRFQLGSRGTYRAEEVDAFVQELTASFEEAYTQNEALLKKISLLADKVEEYRRDEDTIRSALLVAQRTADQVVREAKEKADACLAGAENRAKALEEEANARSGQVMQEASDRAQTLTREVDARVSALLNDASAKAESLVGEAQAKADRLVEEAGRNAQENLAQLREETERESLLLDQTRGAVSEFRANLIAMYKEHIELINRLPILPEGNAVPRPDLEPEEALTDEAQQPEEQPQEDAAETLDSADRVEETEALLTAENSVPEDEPSATAEASPEEEPFVQPEGMMGQFRTVYSAEETPSDASEEEAQLTMGEPGFHLNLEEVVDDEPQQAPVSGTAGEDAVPSVFGFVFCGKKEWGVCFNFFPFDRRAARVYRSID